MEKGQVDALITESGLAAHRLRSAPEGSVEEAKAWVGS